MRIGVLALQGDVQEHLDALLRCGAEAELVRLPDELDAVDGLVVPGGESTTMSHLIRGFDLEEPLRRRVEGGMPCLATCAGLILLSRSIRDGRPGQLALGVFDVGVRRNAYGRQVASFEADLEVPALAGEPFPGVFIRAPQIAEHGPDVEILATHEGEPVAIARGARIGLSFHPELSGDDRLHRLFLERAQGSLGCDDGSGAVGTAA
ncbi:MAG: pyridoxal 5'-phosphate synthase glutaminase subunit PdxT [Candidatus Dormibacteria bacterium]